MSTPENNINDNENNETNEINKIDNTSNFKEVNIEENKEPKNKKTKISIKEALSNKRVRYGTYASIMTLAIIAIVIVLNLVVGQLGLKIDLTKDKMFSLSEQTQQIVSSLDKEVNIYAIYNTGGENIQFMEMLNKYKAFSDKISIITKDPNLNPQFMQKYITNEQTIEIGSIIVESGNRFKVLSEQDLLDIQIDYNTYTSQVTGIALEPKVTGAIQYVTTDILPTAYILEGHNELELNQATKQSLLNENYELKDLDILTQGEVPEDTSIIIAPPPSRDYSDDEANIFKDYLSKGGKAIFILNLYNEAMPNYEKVLAAYGVKPQNLPVLEGSGSNALSNNPFFLVPNIQSHDITAPIINSKLRVVIPMTQAIENLTEKGRNTKITPLLTTSNLSYAKINVNSETLEKEDGDILGPLNLAVLIEDNWFNDEETYNSKVVVISSMNLLVLESDQMSSGANMDFFMNCVNFLVDKQDNISIRSKSLEVAGISINNIQVLIISAIAIIIIPVILLGIGLIIWLRRRNK